MKSGITITVLERHARSTCIERLPVLAESDPHNLLTVRRDVRVQVNGMPYRAEKMLFRRQLAAFQPSHPEQLAEQQGRHVAVVRPGLYHHTTVTPKYSHPIGPCHHTTRSFLSALSVNGMFSLRTSGKASSYMDAWFSMAFRVAPSGWRSNLFWRCALMAGLISGLLGGGGAQVTTSSSLSSLAALSTSSVAVISSSSLSSLATLSTTATSTVNALTASTTYSPTASWTPQPSCANGSTAVGGLGGGVYLDGYGTYWSMACGQDWSGTTFYDGSGVPGAYVSWRASWS
jgi:hypothetical protein